METFADGGGKRFCRRVLCQLMPLAQFQVDCAAVAVAPLLVVVIILLIVVVVLCLAVAFGLND